jgi:type II secretory pathway pseudopilin PulG
MKRPITNHQSPISSFPRGGGVNPSAQSAMGFTFVEMLVTIATFAIIMIVIVNSVLLFYRANSVALQQSFQIESARRGIELMVRDLREATYGDDGTFPLASIASTSITFYSDTDRDNAIERIHYELSDNALFRSVAEPAGNPPSYTSAAATSTVSDYVRNTEEAVPVFRYYNASGVEIENYDEIIDVVSVTVALVVNVQPIRAPEEFTLRSSATLRNLRPQ